MSGGIFTFKHHLVGTREDYEPCDSISKEIKKIGEKSCHRKENEGVEERQSIFGSKGKERVGGSRGEFKLP